MNAVLLVGPSVVCAFAGVGLATFVAGCFSVAQRMSVEAHAALGSRKYIVEASRIAFVVACAAIATVLWTYLLVHLQVSFVEFASLVGGIVAAAFFLYRAGLFVAPTAPPGE
jgi:hypothetical protein